MNEKALLQHIINGLSDDINITYDVKESKLNLINYKPINNEILVKSLGDNPVEYIDRGGFVDKLTLGNFVIQQYKFRLLLISKKLESQSELLEITSIVENAMLELDNLTNEDEGKFILISKGEPSFEENKNFYFRELIFIKLVYKYIGT